MDTIPHRLAPALSRPPGDGWLERGYEQRSSSPRVPRQGSPPPSLRLYTASSSKRRSKGLSRIRRKPYVRFLEGWASVMGSGHSGLERQDFRREEVHPDQDVAVRADKVFPRNGLLALRSGRKAMATKNVAHRLIGQPITQICQGTDDPI